MNLDRADLQLIDGWQRNFPLIERPFAAIARELGAGEDEVIRRLAGLRSRGVLARVGATLAPNTAGASTLAAMRVPIGRLDEVQRLVTAEPCVNHNYEREHEVNLWFVAAGADRAAIDATLARIRDGTGLEVLDLPLLRAFRLDLGFPIGTGSTGSCANSPASPVRRLSARERALLNALSDGLDLVQRPFLELGHRAGCTEGDAMASIETLIRDGFVARFGLIVRHRALGITANAMTVFDVPERELEEMGARLAAEAAITLCYARRRAPGWNYNLYTMVHGRERGAVSAQIDAIARRCGVAHLPRATLFSRRCFKQTGASLRAA